MSVQTRRALLAVLLGVGLAGGLAQPAFAYTIMNNNYPNSPTGCTNVAPWFCYRWPFAANGYSSTTYVYLDPSLNTVYPGDTANVPQTALNAMSRWSAVPARSPFLTQVSSYRATSGFAQFGVATEIVRTSSMPLLVYADTTPYTSYNLTGSGDANTLVAFFMRVNTYFELAPHSSYKSPQLDADFLLTHELGHALGLGHTGSVAIMQMHWPNSVYMGITPTTNAGGDLPGLQLLYNPSFCVSCAPPH